MEANIGPVDRQRMSEICGDDELLAIELIGTFVKRVTPIVAALTELVGYYQVSAVNVLAGSLKGIAAEVGANEVHDAALHLEGVSRWARTPTSNVLEVEMLSIDRALERVRIVQRSWWQRAAGRSGIFAA